MKKGNTKFDIYDHINNVVIEGIEKDGLSWFKPWAENGIEPINWSTGKAYRGINIFWLNYICHSKGYSSNEWMTYKQATDAKGQVRKGEKSEMVFYYLISYFHKPTNKWYNDAQLRKAKIKKSDCSKKSFTLRYYNVFNVDQIDGVEPKHSIESKLIEHTPIEAAESLIKSYQEDGVKIKLGASACYNRVADRVEMPAAELFVDSDSYYKTMFHELVHSTGHENRLKRETLNEFKTWGDETYAKEELIAEIGSMYLSGFCGLSPKDSNDNSVAYIKGWKRFIKDNKYELVSAMTQAVKAVDYIRECETKMELA